MFEYGMALREMTRMAVVEVSVAAEMMQVAVLSPDPWKTLN